MSTINLLPQDYLQRRSQRRPNLLCLALFGVVMAGIGGAAVVGERNQRNTREVCQRINASYAEAARLIDEVHQLEAQKGMMFDKARLSAALMERLPRSFVLAMLSNALPEGASLVSLQMSVQAAKSALAAPKAQHEIVANARMGKRQPTAPSLALVLSIKGKAATDVEVARFITHLARHPLTEMVDLSYSKEAQGKGKLAREFHLTVRLKANADALDALTAQAEMQAEQPKALPAEGGGA